MDDAIKANFKLFYQVLGAYSVITLKDEAKAKEWFTKLLEIDPGNKVANDFLNPPAPEQPAQPAAKPPVKKKHKNIMYKKASRVDHEGLFCSA